MACLTVSISTYDVGQSKASETPISPIHGSEQLLPEACDGAIVEVNSDHAVWNRYQLSLQRGDTMNSGQLSKGTNIWDRWVPAKPGQ
jgi:hypothetical protein